MNDSLRNNRKKADTSSQNISAQELDQLILTLSQSPASRYWCDAVKCTSKMVNETPLQTRLSLKNIVLLEKMQGNLKYVEAGFEIEDEINELRNINKKDEKWSNYVLQVYDKVTDNNRQYVEKISLLDDYREQALKIIRTPEIEEYRSCLEKIEGYSCSNGIRSTKGDSDYAFNIPDEVISKYRELDENRELLTYDMNEYIENFDSRFACANESIILYEQRIAMERSKKEEYEKNKPIIDKYKKIIEQFEANNTSDRSFLDLIIESEDELRSLDFELSEHIHNFHSKWKEIICLAEKEIEALDKEEEIEAIVEKYEDPLYEIEMGHKDISIIENILNLNKSVSSEHFKLSDYISDFESRWSKACAIAKEEKDRIEKERQRNERLLDDIRYQNKVDKSKKYVNFFSKLDSGALIKDCIEEFNTLDKELKSCEFDMEIFIPGFKSRWYGLKSEVDREITKQQAKQERKEKIKKALPFVAIAIGILIIIGGLITLFVLVEGSIHWALAILICVANALLWITLEKKASYPLYCLEWDDFPTYRPFYVVMLLLQAGGAIPLFIIPGTTRVYAIGLSLAVLVSATINFIFREVMRRDNGVNLLFMTIGGIILSLSIGFMIGGMAGRITLASGIALFLILGALLTFGTHVYNGVAIFLPLNIAGAVAVVAFSSISYLVGWDFGLCAIILGVGVTASSIICWIANVDEAEWYFILAILPAILFGLCAGTASVATLLSEDTNNMDTETVSFYDESAQEIISFDEKFTVVEKDYFESNLKRDFDKTYSNIVSLDEEMTISATKEIALSSPKDSVNLDMS
ncbi:MAG: hypothetical protein IJA82_00995 [Clostridia bacterium]|nr:hypothetical protein [Clostridia bacterium]